MEISNNIVLTRNHLEKLVHVLDCVGSPMADDETVSITFLSSAIVVETNDVMSMVKLDNQ